ncbi:uncharacterized protein LOC143470753 [Clavelina lepadiformis]|uniref:uncharacterized protein LOC143470753 n=1 Tax=Clavelina lepadiformis TaxID=159417 RepID=UPI0040436A13
MTTTYLSPTIQNELILLLSKQVKNIVLEEVREAKYFAIMCDSTPDVSHTDQMTLIVRYVTIKNSIAQLKELFLNFFPLSGKTAAEISQSILDELELNNLDVMMCRGKGYDNASTMSGIHTGVQQKIKNINPKALLVPCGNHTLNLAGVHAVGSSHLSDRFSLFYKSLEELCNPNENLNTRGDAYSILEAIQNFSFFFFLCFWKVILRESHHTQTYLQQKGLLLAQCSNKMKTFVNFLVEERDNLIKGSVHAAIKKCTELEIPVEDRRVRRKKRMPGEHAEDAGLSVVGEVRRCMFQALDRFKLEAETRFTGIHHLNDMFGFLNPHALLQSESHNGFTNAFRSTYDDEVDFLELAVEIDRFKRLVRSSETTFDRNATAFDVLHWLAKSHLLDSTHTKTLYVQKLDFEDIIADFASAKARKISNEHGPEAPSKFHLLRAGNTALLFLIFLPRLEKHSPSLVNTC